MSELVIPLGMIAMFLCGLAFMRFIGLPIIEYFVIRRKDIQALQKRIDAMEHTIQHIERRIYRMQSIFRDLS